MQTVRVGIRVLLFLAVTLLNEACIGKKKKKRSKSTENKLRKMAAETLRNFLWVSKTFSANFLRAVYQAELKFKEKQETSFYHIPWFQRL